MVTSVSLQEGRQKRGVKTSVVGNVVLTGPGGEDDGTGLLKDALGDVVSNIQEGSRGC